MPGRDIRARDYSEATAEAMTQVRRLLDDAYRQAKETLIASRHTLDTIAKALLGTKPWMVLKSAIVEHGRLLNPPKAFRRRRVKTAARETAETSGGSSDVAPPLPAHWAAHQRSMAARNRGNGVLWTAFAAAQVQPVIQSLNSHYSGARGSGSISWRRVLAWVLTSWRCLSTTRRNSRSIVLKASNRLVERLRNRYRPAVVPPPIMPRSHRHIDANPKRIAFLVRLVRLFDRHITVYMVAKFSSRAAYSRMRLSIWSDFSGRDR
jgi:hypothetical protein